MSPLHCPGCGVDHHWLACPEVSQSVFPADDPEWQDEEPPPPMVEIVLDYDTFETARRWIDGAPS